MTKRFPNPTTDTAIGQIEVRQLFEKEDFGESEAIERFERMRMIESVEKCGLSGQTLSLAFPVTRPGLALIVTA